MKLILMLTFIIPKSKRKQYVKYIYHNKKADSFIP